MPTIVERTDSGVSITVDDPGLADRDLKLSLMYLQSRRFLSAQGWSGQRRTISEATARAGKAVFQLPIAIADQVDPEAPVLLEIAQLGFRQEVRWPEAVRTVAAHPPLPLLTNDPEPPVVSAPATPWRPRTRLLGMSAVLFLGIGMGIIAGGILSQLFLVPPASPGKSDRPLVAASSSEASQVQRLQGRLQSEETRRRSLEAKVSSIVVEADELRRQVRRADDVRLALETELSTVKTQLEARPEVSSGARAPEEVSPVLDSTPARPLWPDLRAEAAAFKAERDALQAKLDQSRTDNSGESTPPDWPDQREEVLWLRTQLQTAEQQLRSARTDGAELANANAENERLEAALQAARSSGAEATESLARAKGRWGAAVASPNGKRISISTNQVDEDAAVKDARAHCYYDTNSKECALLEIFSNACMSVARPANLSRRWDFFRQSVDEDSRVSSRTALRECEQYAGEPCINMVTSCSPDHLLVE